MARDVAKRIGLAEPPPAAPPFNPLPGGIDLAPSLSMETMPKTSIRTRKVAVLVADGFAGKELSAVRAALEAGGAEIEAIAPKLGLVQPADGDGIEAGKNYLTGASVFYDAVYIPGGKASVDTMKLQGYALQFVKEAFRHAKPIGATGAGVDLLIAAGIVAGPAGAKGNPGGGAGGVQSEHGVVTSLDTSHMKPFSDELVAAIKQHRHWDRDEDETIPF